MEFSDDAPATFLWSVRTECCASPKSTWMALKISRTMNFRFLTKTNSSKDKGIDLKIRTWVCLWQGYEAKRQKYSAKVFLLAFWSCFLKLKVIYVIVSFASFLDFNFFFHFQRTSFSCPGLSIEAEIFLTIPRS